MSTPTRIYLDRGIQSCRSWQTITNANPDVRGQSIALMAHLLSDLNWLSIEQMARFSDRHPDARIIRQDDRTNPAIFEHMLSGEGGEGQNAWFQRSVRLFASDKPVVAFVFHYETLTGRLRWADRYKAEGHTSSVGSPTRGLVPNEDLIFVAESFIEDMIHETSEEYVRDGSRTTVEANTEALKGIGSGMHVFKESVAHFLFRQRLIHRQATDDPDRRFMLDSLNLRYRHEVQEHGGRSWLQTQTWLIAPRQESLEIKFRYMEATGEVANACCEILSAERTDSLFTEG